MRDPIHRESRKFFVFLPEETPSHAERRALEARLAEAFPDCWFKLTEAGKFSRPTYSLVPFFGHVDDRSPKDYLHAAGPALMGRILLEISLSRAASARSPRST